MLRYQVTIMTRKEKIIKAPYRVLFSCLWLALLAGGPIQNAAAGQEKEEMRLQEPVLDDEALGRWRGGFIDKDGFMVSFGLDEVVNIDGLVTPRTVLKIPKMDMAQMEIFGQQNNSAESAPPTFTSTQTSSSAYDNKDAQSAVQDSMGGDLSALVIQNSVDNKIIEHIRTMDIDISGYSTLKNTRINATIKAGLIESLR
jgi:hypothetical protein